MEWKDAKELEKGGISIPKRWLHLHYYEAINILFRSENALRIFVYVVLKNEKQDKWQDTALQVADSEQSTIAKTAARRIEQAKGYGYLGYDITSPLMHLNSGELSRLILSDALWPLFRRYFRGKQEIIRSKLEEVSTVRNALAHFRPIKKDDIELVKQAVRHVYVGIEECLTEIMNINDIVPTNSDEIWYAGLSAVDQEFKGDIRFYQSARDEWIRIALECPLPILPGGYSWEGYQSFKLPRIMTPAIPRLFPKLAQRCIYFAETVPYAYVDEKSTPNFTKHISVVLSHSTLRKDHELLADEIRNLSKQIDSETDLLVKDNLARGKIVAHGSAVSRKREHEQSTWWSTNTAGLMCPFAEDHPPEYWSNVVGSHISSADFIAGTAKYPWMTVEVSAEESPFD